MGDTNESAASSQNTDMNWEQQVKLIQSINSLPVLGLQLTPTPALLERVNQILLRRAEPGGNGGKEQANNSSPYNAHAMVQGQSRESILQQANKLKAENFSLTLLRIGSWERVTKHGGDHLVAKCYFAKRKLVWELLGNDGLKRKMEIQWADILSLRSVCLEGQSEILEIELDQPPVFYHEMDPKPRTHTQWRMITDFTGGQASSFRRHYLQCPPGALDRTLEKLLRHDSRLFGLSRRGFPSLESPFFPKIVDFSFNFGGELLMNPQEQQLSFSNIPTPYQTYQQPATLNPPMSEYNNNQIQRWEDQGRTMMMPIMPSNASSSTSNFQNNYMSSQNQLGAAGGLISMQQQQQQQQPPMFQTLNYQHHYQQQNMLLNNSQIGVSNMVDNSVMMNNALSNNAVVGGGGSQMYPQLMNWPPDNDSFSSSDNNDGSNHDTNNWANYDFNPNDWQ